MATKQKFVKRVAELECNFEQEEFSITVNAPVGKLFKGLDVHYFTHIGTGDAAYPMSAVYDACIDDMNWGLEACEDFECEICYDNHIEGVVEGGGYY